MIVLILDQNHHWNWSARSSAQKYYKMQKTGNIILLEAVPENRNFMVYSQQVQQGRGGSSFCKKETTLGQNIEKTSKKHQKNCHRRKKLVWFKTHSWKPLLKYVPPLCVFTATAVSGIRHRHCPGSPSPLQCVWEGLCWVLPCQRPVLCLGWNILHSLPAKHQEVCDTNTNDTHTRWFTLNKKKTMKLVEILKTELLSTTFCRRFRRQDVRNGDPNTLCSGGMMLKLVFCLPWKPR